MTARGTDTIVGTIADTVTDTHTYKSAVKVSYALNCLSPPVFLYMYINIIFLAAL